MKKVFFVLALIALSSITAISQGYKIGDKAEDFRLKSIDGTMVSMADYPDAKGFVIIFSCNHCPFVVATEDRMIDLHNEYAPKGFPVIAINPNDPEVQPQDSFEKMIERANEKNFPFAYLFDDGQHVYPAFGATHTPHVFLLNRSSGKDLIVEYIGAIDDNTRDASKVEEFFLANAIGALLEGEKPPITETRAIGCSIKVKK